MQPPESPVRTASSIAVLGGAILVLVGTMGSQAVAEMPELLLVDGPPSSAKVHAIDATWQVSFKGDEGTRQVPAADLVRWGVPQDLRRGPVAVLADGGLLVADTLEADKERLAADSPLFGRVQVPLEQLAGVVLQLPASSEDRDRLLDTVSTATGESDQVILTNGDRLAGRLQSIREKIVQIETKTGRVDVDRRRVRALVFNPALANRNAPQGLRALVGFRDGSRLLARRLELNDSTLQVSLAGGLAWSTAGEELVYLQPLGGRVTYLSDMKASDYRHVPFLELAWPYRADRSVTSGWLRVAGCAYAKGLGLHSASRLTYQLTEPYRRLDAQLAVDDSAEGGGSVRIRVFVDGVLKHTSPTIRGGMAPVPISVDLKGAKRLDLVVDFADRADVLDHAAILEARVVR